MRLLLIFRGPAGAGKTTLLHEMGLGAHRLSMDQIRQVVAGPTLSASGKMGVAQEFNDRVYALYSQALRERMGRGELLAVDATFPTQQDLEPVLDAAREHGYRVGIVDLYATPLSVAQARNRERPEIERVPEMVVERMWRAGQHPLALDADVFHWKLTPGHEAEARRAVEAWLDIPLLDLSTYERIVHIGDLQGCWTVLAGQGGPLSEGFRDDTAYVFVGDLVDRGIENGKLVSWFHQEAVPRDNVFFILGNHEDHLARMARGQPPVSAEFAKGTLPQLIQAGVTPAMAGEVVAKGREALLYAWRGQKVMVTHAGLSTVPQRPATISSYQLTHGTGFFEDPVGEQFTRQAPEGWVQVHGHRNPGNRETMASERSFVLEDDVEHGGSLRVLTLGSDGWTAQSFRNQIFAPARERRLPGRRHRTWQADWMAEPSNIHMPEEALRALREHPGVRETRNSLHPKVSSFQFTRQVFFDASWDDVVVKARGLFVHQDTGEIVARSYEKFFNVGEREETQLDAVCQSFRFPVTAYVKENGYLGIIGYESQDDCLFISSKSTPEGPFAEWFREIFETTTTGSQRELLRRFLRDQEASMAFEVIDPVRDPHMISYDKPHLVLLDVFHRSADERRVPYEELPAIAEKFGFVAKQRGMVFRDPRGLCGWMAKAEHDLTYTFSGKFVEGFVLEDVDGRKVKVKLAHYAFWKQMRGAKDRLVRLLANEGMSEKQKQAHLDALGERNQHPLAQAFIGWAMRQPVDILTADILSVRKKFEDEVEVQPEWLQTPWAPDYKKKAPRKGPAA